MAFGTRFLTRALGAHSESITKALGEHSVLMPCGLRRRSGSSYIRGVVRTSLLGMQLVPILGTGVAVADFDGKPFGKKYLSLTRGDQITYQPPPPCPNPKAEWVYGRVGEGYSLGWFPNRLTRPDRTGCTFQHPYDAVATQQAADCDATRPEKWRDSLATAQVRSETDAQADVSVETPDMGGAHCSGQAEVRGETQDNEPWGPWSAVEEALAAEEDASPPRVAVEEDADGVTWLGVGHHQGSRNAA